MAEKQKNMRRKLLAELCADAVSAHGADWPAIERHVAAQLAQMTRHDRQTVMDNAKEILNFQPAPRPGARRH